MRSVHFPLASFCLLLLLIQGAQAQPGRVYKSLTEVTDPQQVYILQLRNKRLKSLPQVVLQMVNLRELDLRGNRIALLPDSIARLQHLERLEVSRNPLMQLPATLPQLKELKELVLWSTYVTDLPPGMETLDDSLELLDLRHCPLTIENQEAIEQQLPSVKKLWDFACNCGD